MNIAKKLLTAVALLAIALGPLEALACPFCSAVSQTLSQEIDGSDVVVLARLVKLPPEIDFNSEGPADLDLDDPDSGTAEFEIIESLRGSKAPAVGSKVKVVYFGSGREQQKIFLLKGIVGERTDWQTPLPLTDRGVEYVKALGTLPKEGPERLVFFLGHLEDTDPLLAQDAYDEFARAPYEVVIGIRDSMDRQQLIDWIEDASVGPTRRRLYLTMLGVCGQAEDVAILESLLLYDFQQFKPGIAAALAMVGQAGPVYGTPVMSEMVKADVRRKQQCLDALIAAYLKLKGPEGLPLIEDRFLTNPAAEYTHVYAAVMALRFHGEETDSLPKPRLLQSVRLLLKNLDIADQVIPDLARWEDWSVMDQLVEMFKTSEEDAWVRQPVISYLLAASDQPAEISDRANAALLELEKLDPKGVKRARSYMAFGLLARSGAKKKSPEKKSGELTDGMADASQAKDKILQAESTPKDKEEVVAEPSTKQTTKVAQTQPVEPVPTPIAAAEFSESLEPSRLVLVGGPLVAGVLLFGVFALLLRGADVRSSNNSQN